MQRQKSSSSSSLLLLALYLIVLSSRLGLSGVSAASAAASDENSYEGIPPPLSIYQPIQRPLLLKLLNNMVRNGLHNNDLSKFNNVNGGRFVDSNSYESDEATAYDKRLFARFSSPSSAASRNFNHDAAGGPPVFAAVDESEISFCIECILHPNAANNHDECAFCYEKYFVGSMGKRNQKPASKYWHLRSGR